MPHEQTIHDAVVKVCPEVMEARSVCPYCNGDTWTAEHDVFHSPEDGSCLSCPIPAPCERCEAKGFILGSPITLSMILRTINKKWTYERYACDSDGNIGHIDCIDHDIASCAKWDLTHDTLEAQPPETKQFLAELLK